jgi:FkbM family methyltransferase
MAIAKEDQIAPEHLVSPAIKDFLESFSLGRWWVRTGRQILQFGRKLRDPALHKDWLSRYFLPLRNAVLLSRPLEVSFEGIPVRLEPRGAVAAQIWTGLRCESHEVSFILSLLEPGMIFFDVGANAGLFAMTAAKKIGGGKVYAFEPCSSTCRLLQQNLRLNGLADVHVEQVALSDSDGKGVLQVNARGRDGLNTLGRATHPHSRVVAQEEVPVTMVDVFLKDRNIPRVDVMKVDIEGAELLLFRGARELLDRPDGPLILYEGFGFLSRGFGYHPVEILWFLESCGYSFFALNGDTGAISELKADYRYDSMIIAVKPGHAAFARCRARVK